MDDVVYRTSLRTWTLNWRMIAAFGFVAGLVLASVAFRLSWDRFLDPFEDGYQNWWTASALLETGTYSDRFSQMTRGNWLPGYTFFAAGLIALFGIHIMPLMKAANILFSLGTTGIIYLLARPRGRLTAGLAAILFVLNPADIVISSFATPEALALLESRSGINFPATLHLEMKGEAFQTGGLKMLSATNHTVSRTPSLPSLALVRIWHRRRALGPAFTGGRALVA